MPEPSASRPKLPPLPTDVPTLQAQLAKALRAVRIADSVMGYCQGDSWERECTAAERAEFAVLYTELGLPERA